MSGNACEPAPPADRRVRRTRERLGDALIALVQEQPFDAIAVQDVLDRAGISRSTFYTHYRDKDDLLLSDLDKFFEGAATGLERSGNASDRVAPVRELFAHVAGGRQIWTALSAAGRLPDFLELGQGHFARAIERRLAARPGTAGLAVERRTALAQMLAGALLVLLVWWIDQSTPGSPAEMDDLYHRLVWNGVRTRG